MSYNYKIILQYDGTRYDGWQKQGNTDHTIQGKLEAVVSKLAQTATEVHGSGRTDAGVHASGQTANFHMEMRQEPEALKDYLNRYLPEDIRVLNVEEVDGRFHSRLNAARKTYTYYVDMSPKKNVFTRKYVYGLGQRLNLSAMEQAAVKLCGTHDFKSFCSNKKMKKPSVRTLHSITFQQREDVLEIRYTGDGFLYNMVRILTGTLIEVGLGKREPGSMDQILEAKDRQAAGYTAPPEGLFLTKVEYE
ncbi:tRNA pseudouridine(38-40) synthase TruA [Clostridium sp. MCC353]|uniref:tRNA pseudouridine(38-40) synthase TruA n=1 Tax=Clostridium sp. MCC353 TaxID=2592646 RepID=UPI001C02040D|nr:tRNA pseudouridine(38-40) synthase TruA [Clostridium sp. MCC353]MBT9776219.1 tRNA pseudouridine(38-40) synthase TruA [Clostridium sp. MCC353]